MPFQLPYLVFNILLKHLAILFNGPPDLSLKLVGEVVASSTQHQKMHSKSESGTIKKSFSGALRHIHH